MRTIAGTIVGFVLMANVAAADDRQYFVAALMRINGEVSEADQGVYSFIWADKFAANLALPATGDPVTDIAAMEHRIDEILRHNLDLRRHQDILEKRILSMNSMLADRQRDLFIKFHEAEPPFKRSFHNVRLLNETTKERWVLRRAALGIQIRHVNQLAADGVQMLKLAHGFKEQLLAARTFPVQFETIRHDATARLTAGAAKMNETLLALRAIPK